MNVCLITLFVPVVIQWSFSGHSAVSLDGTRTTPAVLICQMEGQNSLQEQLSIKYLAGRQLRFIGSNGLACEMTRDPFPGLCHMYTFIIVYHQLLNEIAMVKMCLIIVSVLRSRKCVVTV